MTIAAATPGPAIQGKLASSAEQQSPLPAASIIIVNYNGRRHLSACLRSLLNDCGERCQIIVVDNGSTDGSADEVERLFPLVQVVRAEENLGFAEGCNRGALLATTLSLVFLNPDTVVTPGWLDALLCGLHAHPEHGLATAKILLLDDPEVINTCGNQSHLSGLTMCRGLGQPRHCFAQLEEVSAVSGAAFAIHKHLFETLGGFDKHFFLYMEDTDLSWRARLAGYRCVYVPSAVVYHDYRLRFGSQKIYFQERNRYLLLLKTLDWRTLGALLPTLLLAELVVWLFVLVCERRQVANKLRAYGWLFSHWSQVRESRQATQALRQVCDRDLLRLHSYRLPYAQAASTSLSRLATGILDPLFWLLKQLTLTMVRW